MGYGTYLTASPHTLDKFYRKESLADGRIATAASERSALALSKTGDIELAENAIFGDWVWDQDKSEFLPPSIETNLVVLDQLKLAGKGWREQALAWRVGLASEAPGHLSEHQTLGESFLLGGLRAGYIILRDATEDTLLRAKWAKTMPFGAEEIVSPFTFYQKVEGLVLPNDWVRGTPVSWVVVATSTSRTLQASIDAAATDFPVADRPAWSDIQILDDKWIDDIVS